MAEREAVRRVGCRRFPAGAAAVADELGIHEGLQRGEGGRQRVEHRSPADRGDVARFYAASSPTYAFNLAARQVAASEHRSLSDNARALALVNMATNDSLVASFSAKYHYNFWRPETAIR